MPAEPDRQQLRALILDAEQTIETAAREAIRRYLMKLRAALNNYPALIADATGGQQPEPVPPLTAAELAAAVDEILAQVVPAAAAEAAAAAWPGIVDQTLLPAIDVVLGPVADSVAAAGTSDAVEAVNAWRADWLQKRTQALAGIPDDVTADLREAITRALTEEGPDAARAARIAREMLAADDPAWQKRAETIGRTETGSALNNGAREAWVAVADSLGDVVVHQTWQDTDDIKTRPAHRAVSGTRIKLGETFTVGGYEMTGPHDPAAPAELVINCRCTSVFDLEDVADAGSDHDRMPGLPPASLVAAAETTLSGCVMAFLSPDDAARIAAVDGEPADQMHVTLGYITDVSGLDDATRADLDQSLAATFTGPVPADAFGYALFNPDSDERDPAAVMLVQSGELAALHDRVQDVLGPLEAGTFPIWQPHVTVAYNATTDVCEGKTGPVTFDRLVMAWGDDQHDLTGGTTAAATGGDTVTEPAPLPTEAPPAPTVEQAQDLQAGPMGWEGLIIPTNTVSADHRLFTTAGAVIRQLPLTLSYQAEGFHGGEAPGTKVRVGRILTAEVRDGGVWATGDWLDPDADWTNGEAIRSAVAVVDKGIGTVSVDPAVSVMSFAAPQPDGTVVAVDPSLYDGPPDNLVMVAEQWELMGATLVADPAFDVRIQLVNEPLEDVPPVDPVMVAAVTAETSGSAVVADNGVTFPDGTVVKVGDQVSTDDGQSGIITAVDADAQTVTIDVPPADGETDSTSITVSVASVVSLVDRTDEAAASLVAAAAATYPRTPYRRDWFEPVALDGPTRLTVTDDGRVFGHVAAKGVCHTGFAGQCVTVPSSPSGYAYFHTRNAPMTDGADLPVGVLTVGGGHADVRSKWRPALAHYDESGTAVAMVRAHEDDHGIQVTGQVIHGMTAASVDELRRSPLSGDWREIGGHREMIAALAVNTPGFPIPQAAIGARGEPAALVAAGVVHDAPAVEEPETLADGIVLPSGRSLSREDLALVASMFAAAQRQQDAPSVSRQDGLRARLRLAG